MGFNDKRTLANIPPGEKVLVDSNILTYHLLNHPIYGNASEGLLQNVLDNRYSGFITPIIASETLYNFIKANIIKTYGLNIRDVPALLKREPDILKEIPLEKPKGANWAI